MMNLEKLFELVFKNPENISIEYSNINGKETFLVNGEDVLKEESYDDSEIKDRIAVYKDNIANLDEWIWNLVLDGLQGKDIKEMNDILDLESFTEEEANVANEIIDTIESLIRDVIAQEVSYLINLSDKFSR